MNNLIDTKMSLTNNMELENGAHILYIYDDEKLYIENAVSFISTGLKLGQGILFVDTDYRIRRVTRMLYQRGYSEEEVASVILLNQEELYGSSKEFKPKMVVERYNHIVNSLRQECTSFRMWGCVEEVKDECALDELYKYELIVDNMIIDELQTINVCTYNGNALTANQQMNLMKSHQYVMTDVETFSSNLYIKSPSIYIEEDLEKQNSYLKSVIDLKTKYYRKLLEQMPDGVIVGPFDNIVYANEAALNLLEGRAEDVLLRSVFEFVHSDNLEEIYRRLRDYQLGVELPLTEVKIRTVQGTTKHVEVRTFPFILENGEEKMPLSIIRDISERKDKEALMVKSEKLSVAGQLAAGIAHEIRNPLTAIKGFLQLGKDELTSASKNLNYYSIIESEIDRIETISSELLVLGKPVSQKVKDVNINESLQAVCTLLESQANLDNIHIKTIIEPNACTVNCDESQLKQVFINLIKNAIEAMDKGGIITATSTVVGNQVIIKIKDNGKGIPAQIINKLGEPFYTTKEKGTGLGLMVCYTIIERYSGEISVQTEEGVGTEFTIRLPLAH